jgi:glycosyltransferase involved in cell wall biosynthesis
VVIPNLVDEAVFAPGEDTAASSEQPTILWVGKLARYKRWWDAIRILGEVHARHDVNLILVTGGGLERDVVIQFLGELSASGLAGRVNWLNDVGLREIAAIYRSAARSGGLLLSTSEAESFCLVLHEAMRSGLPGVSTAVGPVPTLMQGLLADSLYRLGSPMDAVAAILRILNDRDLRSRLCEEQRKALSPFDGRKITREYLRLLAHAAQTSPSGWPAPPAGDALTMVA